MSEDVILPKKLPGLNLEDALQRIGISQQVFKTILLKFAETNAGKIEAMRLGIKEERLTDVGMLAHSLKGASSNIGADGLFDAAIIVGEVVKNEADAGEIEKVVDALSVELDLVLGSLKKLRDES